LGHNGAPARGGGASDAITAGPSGASARESQSRIVGILKRPAAAADGAAPTVPTAAVVPPPAAANTAKERGNELLQEVEQPGSHHDILRKHREAKEKQIRLEAAQMVREWEWEL
jgi:hypothetical protein